MELHQQMLAGTPEATGACCRVAFSSGGLQVAQLGTQLLWPRYGEAAFGADPALPKADVLQTLHGFSKDIFRSFGQTKVIEDLSQRLRIWAARATTNRRMTLRQQWAVARDEEVMDLHLRKEVDTPRAHRSGSEARLE